MTGEDLIARFMGTEIKINMMGGETIRYNKSWDDLMPVLDKIHSLACIDVVISINGSCIISVDDGVAYYCQMKGRGRKSIETVYDSVLDFIKWYNNNKLD